VIVVIIQKKGLELENKTKEKIPTNKELVEGKKI
jgi:hypothetical protein